MLLINSAIEVAPHDPELGRVISAHLEQVRGFFVRSIEAAQITKQVASHVDCEQAADLVMAVLLGIRVLARTRPERVLLEGIVDAALAPLGLASLEQPRQRKSRSGGNPKRRTDHN